MNVKRSRRLAKAFTVYYICCSAILFYMIYTHPWVIRTTVGLLVLTVFAIVLLILHLGLRQTRRMYGEGKE